MKRAFVYLSALVALGGSVYLAGRVAAQGQTPAPAPKTPSKVVVFNVMKVLKDYQKFQHFVGTMTAKRAEAMKPLTTLRTTILNLQDQMAKEPVQGKKDELTKAMVAKQREFEDQERQVTAALDAESAQYLRTVYGEIQSCVQAIVQTYGCELVMAYPDAVTPEELSNPMYFSAKLRSQAAMPFFVAPQADVTQMLVDTLNKHYPAPVAATGATQPAPAPPK